MKMTDVPLNPVNPGPAFVAAQLPFGPEPSTVTCPSCGATVRTNIKSQATSKTHLMALLLCLVCVCLAFIPYCVDSCQNADHYCSNCDAYLGSYNQ